MVEPDHRLSSQTAFFSYLLIKVNTLFRAFNKFNNLPTWTRSFTAYCRWPCFSRRVGL